MTRYGVVASIKLMDEDGDCRFIPVHKEDYDTKQEAEEARARLMKEYPRVSRVIDKEAFGF